MNKIALFIILLPFLSMACKNHSTDPTDSTDKPDLMISQITYTRLSNVFHDSLGGVYITPPYFQFDLTIKNIGTKDVTSALFIEYSQSQRDFDSSYCSAGVRANDPPTPLPAHDSIQVEITGFLSDSLPKVLFLIDTNNRYNQPGGYPLIDESNYNNNTYVLPIKW